MYIVAKPRVAGTHRWVTSLSELTCESSVEVSRERSHVAKQASAHAACHKWCPGPAAWPLFSQREHYASLSEVDLESSRKGAGSAAPPEEMTVHTHLSFYPLPIETGAGRLLDAP